MKPIVDAIAYINIVLNFVLFAALSSSKSQNYDTKILIY